MPFFKRKIPRTIVQIPRNSNTISKEKNGELFTRTVQIWQLPSPVHTNYFKAVLDAGCYAGDLITSEVVAIVGCQDKVEACNEVIGMCLHGHPLRSTGTVVLQWEGVGFYKVFETRFHTIEGDCLPWQVILGANTCAKHNLLTVGAGAFGGSNIPVFPKKGKKDKDKEAARKQKHNEEVAANAAQVEKHKNKKAERDQQQGAASDSGASRRDQYR